MQRTSRALDHWANPQRHPEHSHPRAAMPLCTVEAEYIHIALDLLRGSPTRYAISLTNFVIAGIPACERFLKDKPPRLPSSPHHVIPHPNHFVNRGASFELPHQPSTFSSASGSTYAFDLFGPRSQPRVLIIVCYKDCRCISDQSCLQITLSAPPD